MSPIRLSMCLLILIISGEYLKAAVTMRWLPSHRMIEGGQSDWSKALVCLLVRVLVCVRVFIIVLFLFRGSRNCAALEIKIS